MNKKEKNNKEKKAPKKSTKKRGPYQLRYKSSKFL